MNGTFMTIHILWENSIFICLWKTIMIGTPTGMTIGIPCSLNVSNIMIINNKTIGIKVIIMSCIVRLIS